MRSRGLVLAGIALALAGCVAPAPAPPSPPLALACEGRCAVALAESAERLWEPHVAVNPADARHIVAAVAVLRAPPAADAYANGLLVAVSRDGGRTWESAEIPHGPAAPPGHPLAGSRALADPNVAFLLDGTVLVSGLAYNLLAGPVGGFAQGFRAFVARSPDGGATFPDVAIVASDAGVASITPLGHRGAALRAPDAPTMTVAPDGTVHLLWRTMAQESPAASERSVMTAARSSDGGRAWSDPRPIETGGVNAVASQLVATRDGLLLAAVGGWDAGGVTEATRGYQMLARSADGGATWDVATLAEEFVPDLAWWPALADSAGGLRFAYPVPDEAGRERLLVRTSADRGATFGAPVEWSAAPASGHAVPTMSGDGTTAFLTWFEPQDEGAAKNRLLARAVREGAPSAPVVLDDSLTEDATRLGEYFGIAVAEGRAFAVWTNNERGGRLLGAWLAPTPP